MSLTAASPTLPGYGVRLSLLGAPIYQGHSLGIQDALKFNSSSMADDTQPYEAPSAEDYFSDNTQGRGQSQYVRETGASTGIVKARKRPRGPKRCGSSQTWNGLMQFARRISQREFDAQLDRLNIPRPDDRFDMPPILRDRIFPFIGELLRASSVKANGHCVPEPFASSEYWAVRI
jgi:hypothetical protein